MAWRVGFTGIVIFCLLTSVTCLDSSAIEASSTNQSETSADPGYTSASTESKPESSEPFKTQTITATSNVNTIQVQTSTSIPGYITSEKGKSRKDEASTTTNSIVGSTTVNQDVGKPAIASDHATVTQPNGSQNDAKTEVSSQSTSKKTEKPVQVFEDSYFIIYLITGSLLLAVVYILYHNKNKIVALCRKDGPRRTKRPNAADYKLLDQNLSEIITSLKKKNTD
ncbi:trans-Golgi network integral membrane protein TGN38-like [Heptranchias perlo]|uniref:trans-Golgi network integral membrane protein TGN38-like n=1 Tax=Heptranchias perlo TaxID=212740 RepID=UPI00355A2424